MAGERVKNTASAKELAKCLKANLQNGLEDELFLANDIDITCHSLLNLLEDIFRLTLRPTKSVLVDALTTAYDGLSKNQAKPYASAIVDCYTHVREKSYSTSTGKKLHPSVSQLVILLRKMQGKPHPQNSSKSVGSQRLSSPGRSVSSPPSKEASSLNGSCRSTSPALPVDADSQGSGLSSTPAKESHVSISAEDIYKMYGVSSLMISPRKNTKAEAVEIVDSEEEQSAPGRASGSGASGPLSGKSSGASAKIDVSKAKFDPAKGCYVILDPAGPVYSTKLRKGTSGFCVCSFGDQVVTTEVPNLWIENFEKKKKDSEVKKRPASAVTPAGKKQRLVPEEQVVGSSDEDASAEDRDEAAVPEVTARKDATPPEESQEAAAPAEAEDPAEPELPPLSERKFCKMYYKAPKFKAAIRQNHSPTQQKQLGQFGNSSHSKEELYKICDKIIKALKNGSITEDEVRDCMQAEIE